jgi:hypothetical protein
MTPDLMAARLAQIETELKDLTAELGDGGLSEIPDPIDRLAIANKIEELEKEREALTQLLTDTPGSTLS